MQVFRVNDVLILLGQRCIDICHLTANPDDADIVILDTCSVRQHAEDKVWSEIGRIVKMSPHDLAQKTRQIKTGGTTSPLGRKKIIGLVGCMAQNYKKSIFERAPQVDFVDYEL